MDPVLDVVWMFQSKNETIRIAAFINSQFNVFTFTDQFNNRLNHSDSMKGLIIRDLRAEDSGLYEMRITLKNGKETRTGYNLTVYDLVPAPEIQTKLQISSSVWCNFTLHCSVPTNAAALSVSWMYRHTDTEYTPFNQTVDNNGRTVRLSLTQQERDMNLLCLVQNPADQKQAAVSAREICAGFMERGDTGRTRGLTCWYYYLLIKLPLLCMWLLLSVLVYITWTHRRKENVWIP
uniref:Ig-like domain-containing protein n=1 Tax=Leptobrachium leishanense TaxID=445787 RepID=A0A8C5MSY7_9ANUR